MQFLHGAGALAMLAVASVSTVATKTADRPVHAGDLVIEHAWTRAAPDGARVAGGYPAIVNKSAEADKLVGGSLTFEKAGTVQLEFDVEAAGAKASSGHDGPSMPGMKMDWRDRESLQ